MAVGRCWLCASAWMVLVGFVVLGWSEVLGGFCWLLVVCGGAVLLVWCVKMLGVSGLGWVLDGWSVCWGKFGRFLCG